MPVIRGALLQGMRRVLMALRRLLDRALTVVEREMPSGAPVAADPSPAEGATPGARWPTRSQGPPEHWLRVVRERAPQLLRSEHDVGEHVAPTGAPPDPGPSRPAPTALEAARSRRSDDPGAHPGPRYVARAWEPDAFSTHRFRPAAGGAQPWPRTGDPGRPAKPRVPAEGRTTPPDGSRHLRPVADRQRDGMEGRTGRSRTPPPPRPDGRPDTVPPPDPSADPEARTGRTVGARPVPAPVGGARSAFEPAPPPDHGDIHVDERMRFDAGPEPVGEDRPAPWTMGPSARRPDPDPWPSLPAVPAARPASSRPVAPGDRGTSDPWPELPAAESHADTAVRRLVEALDDRERLRRVRREQQGQRWSA